MATLRRFCTACPPTSEEENAYIIAHTVLLTRKWFDCDMPMRKRRDREWIVAETQANGQQSMKNVEPMVEYRKHLVEARQKAQEDYDKTVLALSGGALGISFAFITDIVGSSPMKRSELLLGAWMCWGISMLAVLWSYFASHLALSKAIEQVDKKTIYQGKPGGRFAGLTHFCNFAGGGLFVIGVGLMIWFVALNLK